MKRYLLPLAALVLLAAPALACPNCKEAVAENAAANTAEQAQAAAYNTSILCMLGALGAVGGSLGFAIWRASKAPSPPAPPAS